MLGVILAGYERATTATTTYACAAGVRRAGVLPLPLHDLWPVRRAPGGALLTAASGPDTMAML
eukprot:5313655-Alexandrium_andersonii.AAC.1